MGRPFCAYSMSCLMRWWILGTHNTRRRRSWVSSSRQMHTGWRSRSKKKLKRIINWRYQPEKKRKKNLYSRLVIQTGTKGSAHVARPGGLFSPGWYYQPGFPNREYSLFLYCVCSPAAPVSGGLPAPAVQYSLSLHTVTRLYRYQVRNIRTCLRVVTQDWQWWI